MCVAFTFFAVVITQSVAGIPEFSEFPDFPEFPGFPELPSFRRPGTIFAERVDARRVYVLGS